jgi:hypothetical protein
LPITTHFSPSTSVLPPLPRAVSERGIQTIAGALSCAADIFNFRTWVALTGRHLLQCAENKKFFLKAEHCFWAEMECGLSASLNNKQANSETATASAHPRKRLQL